MAGESIGWSNPLLPVVLILGILLVVLVERTVRELSRASCPGAPSPLAPEPAAGGRDSFLPPWVEATASVALGRRYRDLELVGSGAMGIVLRAWDSRLVRPVAVKIPPPHIAQIDSFRTRFVREARAAAGLNHPNIASVYDVPEVPPGETPVLVMELLEGEDLFTRFMDRGVASFAETTEWVLQVGAGLCCAHENGVIHRDVKPANIFRTAEGRVKLVDFGLAAIEDAVRVTDSGVSLGTPAYTPPEQRRGERIGPSVDQYSLAATIHFLLVGELPFDLADEARLVPERLSDHRPDVPAALDAVLARAMAAAPAERYPSTEAFLADFRAAAGVSA